MKKNTNENKKVFPVIFVLYIILCLSACGGNSNINSKQTNSPMATSASQANFTSSVPTGTPTNVPNPPITNSSPNLAQSSSTVTTPPAKSATPTIPENTNTNLESTYEESYNAFHSGNYAKAITLADKVLKVDQKHYKALNIKGIALSFQNNYTSGMKNIDAALAINPDFGYGRFNKALAYEYNEQIQNAITWYDKALEVEAYTWSYYGKASCYGRIGDVQNTVKNLKIAISMDKVVVELARDEKDFNKVRSSKEFSDLVK